MIAYGTRLGLHAHLQIKVPKYDMTPQTHIAGKLDRPLLSAM